MVLPLSDTLCALVVSPDQEQPRQSLGRSSASWKQKARVDRIRSKLADLQQAEKTYASTFPPKPLPTER